MNENKIFAEIEKTIIPNSPIEGFIWVNMLIKFNTSGNAEVVRTYSVPAKDSYIKKYFPPKKEKVKPIEIKKTEKKESLFN